MDDITLKFIEEAVDLLDNLEEQIIKAEKSKKFPIEEIQRVMHTLKGAGAMYGFAEIEDITHKVESIYKKFEQDKSFKLKKNIIELTLKTIDHIRNVLKDPSHTDETNLYRQKAIISEINKVLGADKNDKKSEEKSSENNNQNNIKTFYIRLQPFADIERRGVNLQSIIDNISSLGQTKILDYYSNSDEEMLYVSWEIYLVTDESIGTVEDYLFFVEDECSIHKIADYNLFEYKSFLAKINEFALEERPLGIEGVKNIIELIDKEENEKYANGSDETHSIKVDTIKLDELMNLLSELVTIKSEIKLIVEQNNITKLIRAVEDLEKVSRGFRKNIYKIRLVSIENLKTKFSRLIRDLALKLDKKINFVTEGMDTELDKTILTKLEAPIMHLIRNSIDHGIESPEERKKKGKNEQGTILFNAFYSGAYVVIQIKDDGVGIDKDKIINKALEHNLIKQDQVLTENDIYNLIFLPGISTAKDLTKVSGRGVGMEIVKTEIGNLGGIVEIQSEIGMGTTFSLKLPISLSIIDTLLVKVGKSHYSVPLTEVEKCSLLSLNELNRSNNDQIIINEELIPYISLREKFNTKGGAPDLSHVVIVKKEDKRICLIVDKVIGQHQAVLKPLNENFQKKDFISGGSMLADGNMSLVLDVSKLYDLIN